MPAAPDPITIAGHLMLEAPRAPRVRLAPGAVTIQGDRITAVTEGDLPDHYDLGGPDCLITPGFVDAHLHLPQFDIIGAHGLPLLDWLDRHTFPAEAAWADADRAGQATHDAIDQLLAHGTTAIAAYATVHHAATRNAITVCKERHLRAAVGQVLMDCNAPDELCRPTDQLAREAAALFETFGVTGRVAASLNPRFAVTASRDLLAACGRLAKQYNPLVQTHLAENHRECAVVRELHGHDYVEVYEKAGLLTPRSVFAHAVWLSNADRATLAASRSVIAHCPTANAFLASGRFDRAAALAAHIPLTLGSDIGAGYERSMPRVARHMLETALNLHPETLPPTAASLPGAGAAEAFWQITVGNATALGWPHTARLAQNAEADLLILKPDVNWLTAAHPLDHLLHTWDDRWLQRTFAAGHTVYPQ